MKKKALCLLMCIIISAALSVQTNAFDYHDNGYALSEDGKERVAIPKPYTVERVIEQFEGTKPTLSNPQDLFLDDKGFYYVADTDNNRILKLDGEFNFITEYTIGGDMPLSKPTGVFTDTIGHLWIADSGNARIVHLNAQGDYIEEFIKPESELLYNVTSFVPTKIAINPVNNYIYVIQGKQFMMLDATNSFKGYVGANYLSFDFFSWLVQNFATEEQKQQLIKREPPAYNNFMMSDDGRIFAVGLSDGSQISVINTVGNNIYPGGNFGEVQYEDDGTRVLPDFSDITVDDRQVISVIEKNTKSIYQYDMEGSLICIFGGPGSSEGFFGMPTSIVADGKGNLVTLDSMHNRIQIFSPTEFITLVHDAISDYNNGLYEKSMENWNRVKEMDSSYGLSRNFIGKIRMKNGQYAESMDDFKQSDDKHNFGKAFEQVRYQFLQNNFYFVVFGIAVLILGIVLLMKKVRQLVIKMQAELWKR